LIVVRTLKKDLQQLCRPWKHTQDIVNLAYASSKFKRLGNNILRERDPTEKRGAGLRLAKLNYQFSIPMAVLIYQSFSSEKC
jgi:hypothetical protein